MFQNYAIFQAGFIHKYSQNITQIGRAVTYENIYKYQDTMFPTVY